MLHSGLDAGTVVAFLHENMLHFVADTAIGDAADALAYLSDAGAPVLTSIPGSAGIPMLSTRCTAGLNACLLASFRAYLTSS